MAPAATNSYSETARDSASGFIAYARSSVDRVVPPNSRQKAYDNTASFASSRPILFSFIVSQLLLSFLPLLIFLTFSLSTIVFALGAAIVFALFWIGVALLVLVPALLVTSSIAVLVWGWAIGSFVIARWLYNHSPVGVQNNEVVKKENGN
ncbi:kinase [Fusarium acutatum]|uniref:Kinase n=1 Tax=Fusarium acutatum TaxID=78861 RepID=A0A8H4JYY0_9HYPO|nr:kinase [Fusarium acutatum]